MSKSSVELVFI